MKCIPERDSTKKLAGSKCENTWKTFPTKQQDKWHRWQVKICERHFKKVNCPVSVPFHSLHITLYFITSNSTNHHGKPTPLFPYFITSLSSASFITVTSSISSIHLLLGRHIYITLYITLYQCCPTLGPHAASRLISNGPSQFPEYCNVYLKNKVTWKTWLDSWQFQHKSNFNDSLHLFKLRKYTALQPA